MMVFPSYLSAFGCNPQFCRRRVARMSPGYRGAPWAKPRTDHIADAPLIRTTAVNAAASTGKHVLVGSAARYMCHRQWV